MASTYSTSLRLELMATGDQSGTWGDTTNTNLGTLLEQAITGVLSVTQGDAELTLTSLDGASDQARNMVVNLTGALTGARNVVVPAPNKLYLIKNSTTGGFAVTVKTPSGTGVTVPAGTARWVYADGTNVVDGISGPLSPSANDAQALGFSGTAWADLFLASGGVINWNAGDVTITHSANTLAFAGVTSGVSFDGALSASTASAGTLLTLTSTDAGATSGPDFEQYRNSASPAANDILGVHYWYGKDGAGNKQEYASTQVTIVDPTSTSEDAVSEDYVTVGGVRTAFLRRAALASGTADSNAVGLPKGQLSFPATQNPSTDPNTLDDYEEGTWTIGIAYGGGTTGLTYSVQVARYTKIGRVVTVNGYVRINSQGSSTGAVTITGLPFASANTANMFSAMSVWIGGMSFITGAVQGYNDPNTTTVSLSQSGTGAATALTNANVVGASEVMLSGSYMV